MSGRDVMVKGSIIEVGVGSIDAKLMWESEQNECGEFVHLALTPDGRWFISITDMEMTGGAYASVRVSTDDLKRLAEYVKATGL